MNARRCFRFVSSRRRLRTLVCLLLVAATAAGGCSNFDLKKNIPWGAGENGEFAPPQKAAAVWTDTVASSAGQPSMRGFGGRLMFYESEGGKPIKVRGTLVVYAFDETDGDTEKVRPDRKYVFTPEQFEKHYSKSALGHSYSVWLPWDEAGGPRREISLLVRFTPEAGPVIVGEASRHNLPGYSENEAAQYAPPQAAAAPQFPTNAPPALLPGTTSPAGTLPSAPAQPLPPTMYAPPAANVAIGATPVAAPNPVSAAAYPAPTAAAGEVIQTAYAAAPGPVANEVAPPRRMSTTTINLPTRTYARPMAPATTTIAAESMAAAPNALALSTAAYAQLTPLQAAAAAAALQNASRPGAAYANPAAAPAPAQQVTAAAPPTASATHYGPSRSRPLGAPIERLTRDHAPWQPSR